MLNYRYQPTPEIENLLVQIDSLKTAFAYLKPHPYLEERFRRESLLKSALFSARIEGNRLTYEEVKNLSGLKNPKETAKLEVFNLERANRFLRYARTPKKLTLGLIRELHSLAMKNLAPDLGRWRTGPWAVFDQSGAAVYLAPPARRVPDLMKEYLALNRQLDEPVPVKAALLQFLFEKIHPFADGNGRVGRLVSTYTLKQGGYGFRGLVHLEEIIDRRRAEYYQVLEPNQSATPFVGFFLEGMLTQIKATMRKISNVGQDRPENRLLPRRREIIEILKDHPLCSFDFLSRRFPAINPKTLHYDLLQLQNKGFIIKAGKTRGSLYQLSLKP